jgi:hypothetical protein
MGAPNRLPLEARRAAWDRLWQILLAPQSDERSRHGTDAPERSQSDAPVEGS